jgi:urease accessory protein
VGTLALEYIRRGDRTIFGRTSCQTPWHLLPPIYLDDSGCAYSLLVNPSGGLVGGDRLSIEVSVRPRGHALISTPSANRVYKSLSEESVQEVALNVAEGAILEWMPEHTIPFAGSRFRQTIDVKLAAGATIVLWDAIASGRIAHGERWRFTSLSNRIHIKPTSGSSLAEHYQLVPGNKWRGVGLAERWDYVGSLFVIGDGITGALKATLEAALAEIVDRQPDQAVLGGVSQPAASGLVVKLVSRSAPHMASVMADLWAAVRRLLWHLPPVALRKY